MSIAWNIWKAQCSGIFQGKICVPDKILISEQLSLVNTNWLFSGKIQGDWRSYSELMQIVNILRVYTPTTAADTYNEKTTQRSIN